MKTSAFISLRSPHLSGTAPQDPGCFQRLPFTPLYADCYVNLSDNYICIFQAIYKKWKNRNVSVKHLFVLLLLRKVKNCIWKQWTDKHSRTSCLENFLFISLIHFMVCVHHSRYFPVGMFIKWQSYLFFHLLEKWFLMSQHVTFSLWLCMKSYQMVFLDD